MDKAIWKSIGVWPYFLGNVLVGVRVVFLPDCFLVLSLLKYRDVGAFKKKHVFLFYIYIYIILFWESNL